MTDREDRENDDLTPTEPIGSSGTEPLRPPVVPSGGGRSSGVGIPGSLLAIGVGILLVGVLVGFLIGNAGDDQTQGPNRGDQAQDSNGQGGGGGNQGGGGQGGGGGNQGGRGNRRTSVACRDALSLSQQIVGAQSQLLANRGQLVEALLRDDTAAVEVLNAEADQLTQRVASLQEELNSKLRRCL